MAPRRKDLDLSPVLRPFVLLDLDDNSDNIVNLKIELAMYMATQHWLDRE